MKYYFIVPKYFGKREIYIRPEDNIWTPNICSKCGGNFVKTSVPIKFTIKGSPCDFYSDSGKLLISSICLNVFERMNLTGYSVLSADAKIDDKFEVPEELKYYELLIDGRCGYAKDINGNELDKCDLCGRRFPLDKNAYGLSFDKADYDGSSIFAFNNLVNFPIVSQELKKQLVKEKLSNMKFIEISELELC